MAELRLPSGHIALVDDDDLPGVQAAGPWRLRREGRRLYVRRNLSYTREQMLHQFLTGWPMTDHANGDGLDNRRANLRPVNDSLNQANRIPIRGSSGFRCVIRRESGRWQAYIRRNGRMTYLGMFDTPEEAARAYDAAAIETWGEYARPNFPVDPKITGPRPRHTQSAQVANGVRPGAGQPCTCWACSPPPRTDMASW